MPPVDIKNITKVNTCMSMEKEMTDLETKLTQLSIGVERTQAILDSGKRVAIKRHLEALQTTAKETNECKSIVEAAKITEKEELSKINECSDEIDHKFDNSGAKKYESSGLAGRIIWIGRAIK